MNAEKSPLPRLHRLQFQHDLWFLLFVLIICGTFVAVCYIASNTIIKIKESENKSKAAFAVFSNPNLIVKK